MNVSYKRSIWTSVIFGILFFFLLGFFVSVGPDSFFTLKIYPVIASFVILVAMSSFAFLMFFTNKKSNIVDERDYIIQKKASSVGLMVSLIYVFLVTIVLFIIHKDQGLINVSWMWFVAYSTFAFGYFFTSLVHVYYYYYESD